jgi:CheY-like chemotaxis protein
VPDAILLDLNTPQSDGFEVLAKLKQCPRLARVPIAVITSSNAISDKHRTGLHGSRYIQKPTQLKEFLASVGQNVKEMLEEGRASRSNQTSA